MLRIAAVSSDDDTRLQLARAFDRAPATWTVTLHEAPPPEADVVVCGPDAEFDDAIRFDPARPEGLIDAIGERVATVGRRAFFVVGATGGCGATTLALHLGAIAKGCVVEGRGDGIRRRLDLADAKEWTSALASEPLELSALPVSPGIRVLLAPVRASEPDELDRIVRLSLPTFDHVIVDGLPEASAPPGSIGVLVLPPTRPGAEAARRVLDSNASLRWAIVTNRLGPGSNLTRRALEGILDRRIAIELPCSAGLRDSEDAGRLVTSPFSPWLWQVKKLWLALATA